MSVVVSDADKRLESGSLTSSRLFLHWHDLHHLILYAGEEKVDNLVLFDLQGVQIYLLQTLDFPILQQVRTHTRLHLFKTAHDNDPVCTPCLLE